jgi:hypothetical protein
MPIPEKVNFQLESMNYYMFNNRRIEQKQKRSLLPRRCFLSNKKIWLKKCEVVVCMVTGPGEPVWETYWCDRNEFLLHELRR